MADPRSLTAVVLVTGTGTGVGKTVTTAALAAVVRERGSTVAVVKPAQTGVGPDEPGDVDEVRRLVGDDVATHELVRLADPLSPEAAARRAGSTLPPVAAHAKRIGEIATESEVVLVEGAGASSSDSTRAGAPSPTWERGCATRASDAASCSWRAPAWERSMPQP